MIKKLIAFMILAAGVAAAQTTPNLGLELPNYQAPNWGVEINYNFMKLDGFLSGGYTLPAFISQGLTLTNLSPNQCVSTDSNGKLVTAGGACSTFTLTTTGTSGPATLSGGVLNIPQYSSIPTGATNQLLYYASGGTAVTPLTLGANLSITGGTLNATSGGITSVNSQTGPAITLESSDSSISVTNPSANTIDLTTAAGGGAYPPNPSTTTYILTGDSYVGDDINVLSSHPETITAWDCNSSVANECIYTVASTTGYAPGDFVAFGTDSSGNPQSVTNDCATANAHGDGVGYPMPYGCANYKVLPDHFTSTTFAVAYTGTATTCTSSCGTGGVVNANSYVGAQMQNEPAISGHGSVMWMNDKAYTLAALSANAATDFAGIPDGTSASPVYLIIGSYSNDIAAGSSASQIEGYMQTLMEYAHTHNWIILISTIPALKNTATAAAIDYWLRQQVKTNASVATGNYLNWQFDAGPKYVPYTTFWYGGGSLEPQGARMMAQFLNQVAGLNQPIQTAQYGGNWLLDGNQNWNLYTGGSFAANSYVNFIYGGTNPHSAGSQVELNLYGGGGTPMVSATGTQQTSSGAFEPIFSGQCSNSGYTTTSAWCGLSLDAGGTGGNADFSVSNYDQELRLEMGASAVPWYLHNSGQMTDAYYASAACLSADASGNIVSGTAGTATLTAGTVTVSSAAACTIGTACTYQLTNCGTGGTVGVLSVGTITAGTSFVINSSSSTDTSTVCWEIIP